MICKICEKEITAKGFGSHLFSHKISAKDYYDKYLKQENEGICPVCGKDTVFLKLSKGYQKHCSIKCASKNPDTIAKVNNTRKNLYSVNNFFQDKTIHDKAEKNAHSKKANEKKKNTCLEHFGVDNPAKSKEIIEKIQKTNLELYGSRAYNLDKRKITMVEKYGHEHALQCPEIKAKQENTERAKWEQFAKDNNYLYLKDMQRKYGTGWYQSPLGKKIVFNVGQQSFIKSSDENKIIDYVNECGSRLENSIYDYIKSIYSKKIIRKDRKVIKPFELDLYIPDLNLAIEINGTYWHSEFAGKDKHYHFNKSKECEAKGIRLIHIYEWEWLKYSEKIKQLLNIALGKTSRIYARQCEVKQISNREAKPFNENTHLQGHRHAEVTYGLFYKNELVQLMSFSKTKYNRNLINDNEWEIIRGCPGSNNIVVGGVSKLFKHFLKDYNPSKVFSYCDFNKFDGKSYLALGMEFVGYTGPNKWWILEDGSVINRNPSRYHELKHNNKLWGSGSKKYIWYKKEE